MGRRGNKKKGSKGGVREGCGTLSCLMGGGWGRQDEGQREMCNQGSRGYCHREAAGNGVAKEEQAHN